MKKPPKIEFRVKATKEVLTLKRIVSKKDKFDAALIAYGQRKEGDIISECNRTFGKDDVEFLEPEEGQQWDGKMS